MIENELIFFCFRFKSFGRSIELNLLCWTFRKMSLIFLDPYEVQGSYRFEPMSVTLEVDICFHGQSPSMPRDAESAKQSIFIRLSICHTHNSSKTKPISKIWTYYGYCWQCGYCWPLHYFAKYKEYNEKFWSDILLQRTEKKKYWKEGFIKINN